MADQRGTPRTGRLYRALLRLLPFEFRSEFGRDMEEAFSDERHDLVSRRSRTQMFRFWIRTLMDLGRTAPREQWDILRQDVRAGARLLSKGPAFALAAILTLALGIGGSTSIFSVVYGVVLRPLEFPQSERVVHLGWASTERGPDALPGFVSFRAFQTLKEKCKSLELVGATRFDSLSSDQGPLRTQLPASESMSGLGPSYRLPVMASASLFEMVGPPVVLGRLPDERDESPGAPPVVVISYSTWTSVYGRDAKVLGRALIRHLDDGRTKPVTVVGVLAADAFKGLWGDGPECPAVASLDTDVMRDDSGRNDSWLTVYGRLAHGFTVEATRAELAALSPGLWRDLPKAAMYVNASLRANRLRDERIEQVKTPLLFFLWAVLGLLLVACVNVSSLILARTISRRHEFATRFALGARPFRVARQLLTECAILAVAGGLVGIGLAWAVWSAFVAISPSMPRLKESGIGGPAVLFALAAVVLATCVSALAPALVSSRRNVVDGLRSAGGAQAAAAGFSKPLALLGAAEVVVVLVLLTGTGLLVNSFARLVTFDLGFDARSIAIVSISSKLPPQAGSQSPRSSDQFQTVATLSARQRAAAAIGDEILQRVAATPGISAAGLTGDDPFGLPYRYSEVQTGDADPPIAADRRVASASALEALGLHLAGGRWFSRDDREGMPLVAVVNETMARTLWSGRNPVGHLFHEEGRRVLQVVGVVADAHNFGARKEAKPTFYVPTTQTYPDPVMLVVRQRPEATGVERLVAATLARDGRITAGEPRQLEQIWWKQLADARFLTLVASVFSLLTLAIALVGIHGVLRFSTAQRTREMGIRKALGASDSALVALVISQALRFTLPACVVGLVVAWAAAPTLQSLLFGVAPSDRSTMVTAVVLVVVAVVVAAYFPARRASRVDPMRALRVE